MAETFFSMFTPEEIARISASGTKVTLPEGWAPISEKTGADKAYILLKGTVSVRAHGDEVAQLGPGDIVGEAAILNHSLRTASIVALTPLELIHFTKEQLEQLNVDMPSFHDALEKTAAERFPTLLSDRARARPVDLSAGLDAIEELILGEAPHLTRLEVVEQAGVPLEVARELWRLLGFAEQDDDDVAFTQADVQALQYSHDLMKLGILSPERQAALVRTWGRSFARLAEWQTRLLTEVALESDDPVEQVTSLTEEVMPRLETLQNYVWRQHLAKASRRMMTTDSLGSDVTQLAVVFVDIVGFTSRSKELSDSELVSWIEHFEAECSAVVNDHGGRVIKNIGDEVLFVADDLTSAADVALVLTSRGADDQDEFPSVRAGLAYGEVVARLGDVLGPTVNIASRLTSIARPGTVLVDDGAHDRLSGDELAVRLPQAEADLGQGLRPPAAVGAAPGLLSRRPHVEVPCALRCGALSLRDRKDSPCI